MLGIFKKMSFDYGYEEEEQFGYEEEPMFEGVCLFEFEEQHHGEEEFFYEEEIIFEQMFPQEGISRSFCFLYMTHLCVMKKYLRL